MDRLEAKPEETIYVGDSPLEDIEGAKATGMMTVFIPSQFYSLKQLRESHQMSTVVVHSSYELYRRLPSFISNIS